MYSWRMRAPSAMFASGSHSAASPPWARSSRGWYFGMICINPLAPMTLSAMGLKPDSMAMTARTRYGSSPTSREARYAASTMRSAAASAMRKRRDKYLTSMACAGSTTVGGKRSSGTQTPAGAGRGPGNPPRHRARRRPHTPNTLEGQFKGTADAVYQYLDLVQAHAPDIVAVFAADHIYRMDVRQMVDFHGARAAGITVSALAVPLEAARSFGVLKTAADGRVLEF